MMSRIQISGVWWIVLIFLGLIFGSGVFVGYYFF